MNPWFTAGCAWLAFNAAFVALRMWATRKHVPSGRTTEAPVGGEPPESCPLLAGAILSARPDQPRFHLGKLGQNRIDGDGKRLRAASGFTPCHEAKNA